MGNFHGGGTIIKGGRFTTFDPADDGYRPPSRSKKREKTSSQSPERNKSRRPPAEKQTSAGFRKSTLHSIIDQMFLEREKIKLPRAISSELDAEISRAGGPRKWAESQPEYAALQEKRIQKRERANAKSLASAKTAFLTKKPARKVTPSDIPPENTAKTTPAPSASSFLQTKRDTLTNIAIGRHLLGKQEQELPPDIPVELLAEVKKAGNLLNWARNQRGFENLYGRRLAKHEAHFTATRKPLPTLIQASGEYIRKTGFSRLLIARSEATDEEIERLAEVLGILPTSPRLMVGGEKKAAKNRKAAKKSWQRRLSPKQQSTWQELSEKQKMDYLFFGKISPDAPGKKKLKGKAAKPQKTTTLGDVTVSFIKSKLSEAKDDDWDIRKIDWSST